MTATDTALSRPGSRGMEVPRPAYPALRPLVIDPRPLLLASAGFGIALLLQLVSLIWPSPDITGYGVTLLCLCSSLVVVRALYPNGNRFLFSTGFWLVVTVFFYMVLKSIDTWSKDLISDTLVEVLWLTIGFILTYCVAFIWTGRRLMNAAVRSQRVLPVIPPGGEWLLLLIYAGFKVFGVLLMAALGGGGDQLEVLAATQNAGASYIFRIPQAGNVIFLGLLFHSFKTNRGWSATGIALALYLGEAVLSTSRLAIVMLVLTTTFLYHRYRRPIPMLRLAFISAPLVLVVVLFGYARNIEVGSAGAYAEAIQVLTDEPTLVTDLFMARMDLLPEMVLGLDLYKNETLQSLNGASYIYAFLHSIPRNLWEAKPPLTAALLTAETHPIAFADGVNIFPSLIVEGILNFSYAGVVLTGLLTGYLARQFERIMDSEHLGATAWSLAAFTFPMGLFNEGVHSNFTGNMLYMTALMALIYKGLLICGALKRQRTTL